MRRSSILLAGGLGTRLNGREKALMVCEGRTLLERTLDVLDNVSDEVIVSLRDESQLRHFSIYLKGRKVVFDSIRDAGPLAGMLAGFEQACTDYVFAVACDMPFINPGLMDMMFGMVMGHDALVPINENGVKEPLHAVYRRDTMLEAIKVSLDLGHRSILSPVLRLDDVIYMDTDFIKMIDKGLKSFVNINTPSDVIQMDKWKSDNV